MDALHWKMRVKRSNRSQPPQSDADEISAAESLLLLSISGGGFCSTIIDTAPPKKHQELSPSAVEITGDSTPAAANAKKQEEISPDTLLQNNHCCGDCGEVFQSFQALGGHMTSHRVKIVFTHRNSAAKSERSHECSFCHERFATGQALGGHKRKHRARQKSR